MSIQTQHHEAAKVEKEKKGPSDWRTQITWEKIYKTISIVLVTLIPFFMRDMFLFREEIIGLGHQTVTLMFLTYSCIFCVVITVVRQIYMYYSYNKIYSIVLFQYQGDERDLYTKKIQKLTFDLIYYTLTSIYGYIYFKNTPWYPIKFSSEEGDTLELFTNWPGLPTNEPYYKFFNIFLIIQFGQNIWGVLDLIIVQRKKEKRFYEWFVHHLLASTLIFYSVYFNFQIMAVSVLIIHDIGSIFILVFKIFREFKSTGVLFIYFFFQMIVGWFLTRVYLYPKVIIWPIIINRKFFDPSQKYIEYSQAGYIYQTIMLSLLYLMHIYWFAQMVNQLASYISKSLKDRREKKDKGYENKLSDKNKKRQ